MSFGLGLEEDHMFVPRSTKDESEALLQGLREVKDGDATPWMSNPLVPLCLYAPMPY